MQRLLDRLEELSGAGHSASFGCGTLVTNEDHGPARGRARVDQQTGSILALPNHETGSQILVLEIEPDGEDGRLQRSGRTGAEMLSAILRDSKSRQWLRRWLATGRRAEQLRELIERAPESMRQALVDVLWRLLADDGEGTMLEAPAEASAQLRLGGPLPLPMLCGPSAPLLLTYRVD
jgi:hypothetical protein